MISRKAFVALAEAILNGAKQGTKYFGDREILRATFQGKRRKNQSSKTILFTMGRPNYAERQFIKKTFKAGKDLPKHLILKY